RELAEIVRETVVGCRIEYAKDAGPDTRCYRVNFSKIGRALPEFKPQWNARQGAKQLYEAYLNIGLSLEAFEAPRYKRTYHMKQYISPNHIFSDYAYFSSYSDTWLQHVKDYTDMIVERFGLQAQSQVVELASNDGYLLQYFAAKGVPVLGIEPAANVAEVAL